MKRVLFKVAVLAAVICATDAQALFTRCEVDYKTKSLALGFEGGGGEGRARCWDAFGDQYVSRFDLVLGGAGIRAGYCETSGHFSAAGVGFSLNELLVGMGQIDIGPHLASGNAIGGGVRVSPLGASVNFTLSNIHHGGFCPSLGRGLILISTSVTRPTRVDRRRSPPPPIIAQQPLPPPRVLPPRPLAPSYENDDEGRSFR